jgi:hypothetical protein
MNAPVLFPTCTQNLPHKNIAISAATIGRMDRYIINIAIITISLMNSIINLAIFNNIL